MKKDLSQNQDDNDVEIENENEMDLNVEIADSRLPLAVSSGSKTNVRLNVLSFILFTRVQIVIYIIKNNYFSFQWRQNDSIYTRLKKIGCVKNPIREE